MIVRWFRMTLLVSLLMVGAVPVWAGSIPWKILNDANGLNKDQRARVGQIFASEKPYAGCKATFSTCLKKRPVNKHVIRQANYLCRRTKKRTTKELIMKDFKRRADSFTGTDVYKTDTKNRPLAGNADALLKVVVYADFECPYCRIAGPAARRIAREKPEWVSYTFKNFPLKSHPHSITSALALMAADEQGKFWDMHDRLFTVTDLSYFSLIDIAKSLKLNMEQFEKDLKSDALVAKIREDKLEGIEGKMRGTPGVFINGKPYFGVKTYEELLDFLEETHDSMKVKP